MHFGYLVKLRVKSAPTGLSGQSSSGIVSVMVRGTTSRGTKKCRKFTYLVNSVTTVPVISAALMGRYCALNHYRNGCLDFVNRLPLIQ
jgi:hypothetical protein